jgi:hypothetical protein
MHQDLSHLIRLQDTFWMRLMQADGHAILVNESPARSGAADFLVTEPRKQTL